MSGRFRLILFAMAILFSSAATSEAAATARGGAGDCCDLPAIKAPCITYNSVGCRKFYRGCESPLKITVEVVDPCCCKHVVAVPMCVPACCQGMPCVKSRCGLFGRGIVWYEWCCGFKARVVFDKCGDVNVTYFGR